VTECVGIFVSMTQRDVPRGGNWWIEKIFTDLSVQIMRVICLQLW